MGEKSSEMSYSDPNLTAKTLNPCAYPQIGAVCWRLKNSKIEVLLVTSRDTGRWVIPKGWPMAGLPPHEAAVIEAWEEAGVEGCAAPLPLGQFYYEKLHAAKPAQTCEVTVYPLRVKRLADTFPEAAQRRRKWFSAQKAAKQVAEAGLAALFLHMQDTLLPPAEGA
jgi:8-oxo-dGTP pyrophosphatase MutT (NUDIX family)